MQYVDNLSHLLTPATVCLAIYVCIQQIGN